MEITDTAEQAMKEAYTKSLVVRVAVEAMNALIARNAQHPPECTHTVREAFAYADAFVAELKRRSP